MTLKQFTCAIASLGVVLATTIATAAPIAQQARICRGFAAGKYKVSANLVAVTPFKRNDQGDYINWQVPKYSSRGYCFITQKGETTQFVVEKGAQPGAIGGAAGSNAGFSKVFKGIPRYDRGVRVKLNDYYDKPSENRRYFIVKLESNNARPVWSVDCRTEDQVYDLKRVYLGYDPDARALAKFVCALGARPTMQPQPR